MYWSRFERGYPIFSGIAYSETADIFSLREFF